MRADTPKTNRGMVSRLIREHPIWRDASAEIVDALAAGGRSLDVRPGQIILLAGQAARNIYLLCEGRARILLPSAGDAKEVTVKLLSAPVSFGEAEVVLRTPWAETVQSLTHCRLLELDGQVYLKCLSRDSTACFRQFWEVACRFAIAVQTARHANFADVNSRLIAVLVAFSHQFPATTDEGTLINYGLTHFDLAQQCGSSTRTVVRALGLLYQKGLLRRRGRRFLIPSEERLLEAAEFPVPRMSFEYEKPWVE